MYTKEQFEQFKQAEAHTKLLHDRVKEVFEHVADFKRALSSEYYKMHLYHLSTPYNHIHRIDVLVDQEIVRVTTTDSRHEDYEELDFPVSYLFLDEVELQTLLRERLKEEVAAMVKAQNAAEAATVERAKIQERELYLKLKAKFEGTEPGSSS